MPNSLSGNLVVAPTISGNIANETTLSASLAIAIGLDSTITIPKDFQCEGANITLPALSLYGEGFDTVEANASFTLPSLILTATGVASVNGIGTVKIPLLVVSAEGSLSLIGEANLTLPSLVFSAQGLIEESGNLSISLPSLEISAAGIFGVSGTLEQTLPVFSISATGLISVNGTANISLPIFTISASESLTDYLNMVMNIRNKALTLYNNYNFNSMCQFNGKSFGATETAIHDLDNGTTDNNTNIEWNFKTGYLDLHQGVKKKLIQAWFSYKSDGDLILSVICADGEEYEYSLEGINITEEGLRVKVGKGIRKNYVALNVKNVSGSSIVLDTIALNFEKLGKIR
jgi:hypothetical protein